jgi:hypothetical protein
MYTMLGFINLPLFILSLALGTLFVYMYEPDYKTIHVFPTPENVDKVLFKDRTDMCYGFQPNKVSCPKDSSKIANYVVQN